MIATAVLAAVLTNADAEREALAARWSHASASSIPASRRLREPRAQQPAPGYSLRALAASELASPGRYRLKEAPQPPAKPPWWQRPLQWIAQRWRDFWNAVFGNVRVGSKTTAAIGDVVLLLVAAVTLFAAWRLVLAVGYRRRRANATRPLETVPDASTLYARASELAACGRYAQATQFLFRATLALLDVRGAVRDDASATVGDVRRKLRRDDPAAILPFDTIAAAFVAGTYAERPIGETEWARARDAYAGMAGEGAT